MVKSNKNPLALYIHIPFCRSKCAYCDFLSFPKNNFTENEVNDYINTLIKEIKFRAEQLKSRNYIINSIFIGGGTPSVICAERLARVLEAVADTFEISPDAEVTVESNPESVEFEKLKAYRNAGINRLSLGIQSFSDVLLKKISRAHSREQALEAYSNAVESGFDNINIDLMFGLPKQTVENVYQTLEQAVALKPAHISFYGLILEEGSALYRDKSFTPVDDETDRKMYYAVKKTLKAVGYEHYEISNFALPNRECRHNSAYWTGMNYIGVGLGAHSFINSERFHATCNFKTYLRGDFDKEDSIILNESDKYAEFFFLGLRFINGVSANDFCVRFGKTADEIYGEELIALEKNGLITRNADNIRLTEIGVDLSNRVFEKFI